MPAILVIAIYMILIICLAYVGFWLVAKIGLPDPAALIARIIVGVLCLLLLLGLFVPSMGVSLPGL